MKREELSTGSAAGGGEKNKQKEREKRLEQWGGGAKQKRNEKQDEQAEESEREGEDSQRDRGQRGGKGKERNLVQRGRGNGSAEAIRGTKGRILRKESSSTERQSGPGTGGPTGGAGVTVAIHCGGHWDKAVAAEPHGPGGWKPETDLPSPSHLTHPSAMPLLILPTAPLTGPSRLPVHTKVPALPCHSAKIRCRPHPRTPSLRRQHSSTFLSWGQDRERWDNETGMNLAGIKSGIEEKRTM